MAKLRRLKAGDSIDEDFVAALADVAVRANLTVAQGGGLQLIEGPGGYVLTAGGTSGTIWAKTTGAISGGKYPFTQQIPAASGAWTAGSLTGNAYEVNGNTAVPTNTYIRVEITAEGDYRFRSDSC